MITLVILAVYVRHLLSANCKRKFYLIYNEELKLLLNKKKITCKVVSKFISFIFTFAMSNNSENFHCIFSAINCNKKIGVVIIKLFDFSNNKKIFLIAFHRNSM